MASIFRSHLGHAREATYGSTGTGTVFYIPVTSYDEWEDDRERILDSGIRGVASKDFFVYQGVNKGRTGYTWMNYPTYAPRFLKDIFGLEVVAASSAGDTGRLHTFGSTDLPLSATLYDYYGVPAAERRWHGAQMERMELKFDAGSGAMTMKTVYRSFAASTGITETSASYTTDTPKRGWEGALTLGGSTNNRLIGFNITFAREVNLVFSASNSQNPISREVGPLEVTGTCSFYGGTSSGGSTDTEYSMYRNNTSTSLSLMLAEPGASSFNSFQITMSNMNFYPVTVDRGGSFVRYDAPFRAFHNATDSGPASVNVTLISTVATT
jgi:hypothetical protein